VAAGKCGKFNSLTHALAPLLAPRSIALVGASRKRNSVGNDTLRNLLACGWRGELFPVNPGYANLYGMRCYAGFHELPDPVDLAILSVPNRVLERTVAEAITAGTRALAIFASAELEDDGRARIAAMARAAGVPVCGANCMGFYHLPQSLAAFSALMPRPLESGGLTCIAQSGSLMLALLLNDERLAFNLAVSSGQELVTSSAQFLDYALEQPSTRAVALILEAVREPERFLQALEKARRRDVPVIFLKLARTAAGASLALSHTGAIAGDAELYEAMFRRFGVLSVRDLPELAATASLLCAPRRAGPGGLSAILDSGGERELLVDVAAEVGVPFARIGAETVRVLREQLDPGLEPINPLDAWGTGREFEAVFETCLSALQDDPDTALAMFICDFSDELDLHAAYVAVCEAVAQRSPKLLVAMTNYSAWSHRRLATRLRGAGIPVLDGTQPALRAVRHALEWRDFRERAALSAPPPCRHERADHWQRWLATRTAPLTEDEGYALLSDYGIEVPRHRIATSAEEALVAGRALGFPVVMKTAMPGVLHKSDVGGVRLGIRDEHTLAEGYRDLAARLGPRVLISAQAPAGLEMALGLVRDAGFGSFVMAAFGGTWIEYLKDRTLVMAPLDEAAAARAIAALRLAPVLDGVRGAAPCDRPALQRALVRLGALAQDLGAEIAELDLNPLIVSAAGAVAVDCLLVPRAARGQGEPHRA